MGSKFIVHRRKLQELIDKILVNRIGTNREGRKLNAKMIMESIKVNTNEF